MVGWWLRLGGSAVEERDTERGGVDGGGGGDGCCLLFCFDETPKQSLFCRLVSKARSVSHVSSFLPFSLKGPKRIARILYVWSRKKRNI